VLVNLQEYLVLDGSSMQTVAADGQHTSFESTAGRFNRFVFIDEFGSIVGWMLGETELHVGNKSFYLSSVIHSSHIDL